MIRLKDKEFKQFNTEVVKYAALLNNGKVQYSTEQFKQYAKEWALKKFNDESVVLDDGTVQAPVVEKAKGVKKGAKR